MAGDFGFGRHGFFLLVVLSGCYGVLVDVWVAVVVAQKAGQRARKYCISEVAFVLENRSYSHETIDL